MRAITDIVVHCSATPAGKAFRAADIRRWHTDPPPKGRGWPDIGYHFVIDLDGTVETGRPLNIPGAHVEGHNASTIGICYVGGLLDGKAHDTRTPEQIAAMAALLSTLRRQFPRARIRGHRDFPGVHKDCPSFDVATWCRSAGIRPESA